VIFVRLIIRKQDESKHARLIERFKRFGWEVIVK